MLDFHDVIQANDLLKLAENRTMTVHDLLAWIAKSLTKSDRVNWVFPAKCLLAQESGGWKSGTVRLALLFDTEEDAEVETEAVTDSEPPSSPDE